MRVDCLKHDAMHCGHLRSASTSPTTMNPTWKCVAGLVNCRSPSLHDPAMTRAWYRAKIARTHLCRPGEEPLVLATARATIACHDTKTSTNKNPNNNRALL